MLLKAKTFELLCNSMDTPCIKKKKELEAYLASDLWITQASQLSRLITSNLSQDCLFSSLEVCA